jgi:tetratricopeptide (TPR) repeat protein
MKENILKYSFILSAGILLLLMVLSSGDAGISCDEVLHYNHSGAVYNYFATHGRDKSALETPVTHLKYYGQSYDNITTILARWFRIDNVYRFRHLMSPLAGWLTVLVTALFALWLSGYRTALLVIVLYAISPTFLGHSQNNLKDIPFALGYISSVFFILKFLESGKRFPIREIVFLILGIAFTISIRAGGLLLICYMFFFWLVYWIYRYLTNRDLDSYIITRKIPLMLGVTVLSWLLGILLWPYALQNPVKNVIESYRIMAHFPDTFRQIFEGRVEWSDFMPWYYLIKSMAITIPLLVLAGLVIFFFFPGKIVKGKRFIHYLLVLFTILFPIVFVLYDKSNLYSSWRQFLFVYPAIILISATGFNLLFEKLVKTRYTSVAIIFMMSLLSLHPLLYMLKNHRYSYIYYNQFTGGLHGAYGNYETDYYYVSQTEASRWLIEHLKGRSNIKVKATYSVSWLFRDHPEIETSYFRYEERSMTDWDYAIVVNRYIPPYQLKHKIWPPGNSIHLVMADGVPICAVLERRTKDDLCGYIALSEGKNDEAINYFKKALSVNDSDEMIFYNFATALYNSGKYQEADSALKKGLEINPGFEPILMYLGNIARTNGKPKEAIYYYERLIRSNRKYFEAYVSLADLLSGKDINKARGLLRTCLEMNPGFRPAVMALGDTYKQSDPDIAAKYYEMAEGME